MEPDAAEHPPRGLEAPTAERTPTATSGEARPTLAFFRRYGRAFEAHDAAAVAAFYVVPCLFVRDGETEAIATADGVAASVRALLDLHRAWDVARARPVEVVVLEETAGHAIARVQWRLGRARSRMTWEFATTYTLVPSGDDWLIATAVTHDAPF